MNQITNISKGVLQGLVDSIRGTIVVFYLDREVDRKRQQTQNESQEIDVLVRAAQQRNSSFRRINTNQAPEESSFLRRVINCCCLNGGVVWVSINLFEYGLLPFLRWIFISQNPGSGALLWSYIQPVLSLLISMLWILPLFILSRMINGFWFQDIADSAYKIRKGRPQLMPSLSKLIADTLFSLLVQTLFLVQSVIVSLIPNYIGTVICFIHMCLLYSLYSFEYKWFNMGWELHKRLTFIEYNWAYFIGFGMPLAILTALPSSYIVSGCVFAMLFPFFILSGNEASPLATSTCEDYPLKLFSPVVAISNSIFNKTISAPLKTPTPPVAGPTITSTPVNRSSGGGGSGAGSGGGSRPTGDSRHSGDNIFSNHRSGSSSSSSHRNSPSSSHRSSPSASHRNSPSMNTRSSNTTQSSTLSHHQRQLR